MAAAGVVAVSLPLATHVPRTSRRCRRGGFIDAGVAVAVATDFNPGSAPSFHLPLALTLACTLQRMTPAEALKGATIYAARALGREAEVGSLEAGQVRRLRGHRRARRDAVALSPAGECLRADRHRRGDRVALVAPWDRTDPRVENIMGRAVAAGEAPHAVLLGFPTDEGVLRNGGRPGAARGPAEIRRWLARFAPDARDAARFTTLLEHTADLGDIALTGNLDADQAALGEVVGGQLRLGRFVIILGGGHETSFGHFLGLRQRAAAGGHPQLGRACRCAPAAGPAGALRVAVSPGTRASSGALRRYSVAGLQPHAVAAAHLELVRKRGRAVFRDEVTPTVMRELYAQLGNPAFVSFDLDAVDQAFAPGVSAPCTGGFTPAEWLAFAQAGGRHRDGAVGGRRGIQPGV